MENKKYYFSIFFQDSESVETFDELREKELTFANTHTITIAVSVLKTIRTILPTMSRIVPKVAILL